MEGKGKGILIIAGEASGDLHGSSLIRALLKKDKGLRIYGVGGKRMVEAGLTPLYDSSRLSIVGLTEAIKKLPFLLGAYKRLKHILYHDSPTIAILIDYPEFNLFFARHIKRCGIPIVYFISPQVWAWRSKRIKKIARLVDKMIVIFPFEVPLYVNEGVDVEFLGHPILDEPGLSITPQDARDILCLTEGKRIISLLPGSRVNEIDRLLPAMLDAGKIISEAIPDIEFLLPLADGIDESYIDGIIERRGGLSVRIFKGRFYEVLKASDAAIVVSGTATLQAALSGIPMVVIYKLSPLSYWIGRRLINIDTIAMVNIIAGEKVVEELIQNDATPQNIADGVLRLFEDRERERILKGFSKVRQKMGEKGGTERIASTIYGFLKGCVR